MVLPPASRLSLASGARGQTAMELFLVLAMFLTIFVWTNGLATVLGDAKSASAAVQSEAILRVYVNHEVSAEVDATNLTFDEPCLSVGGQGYAYYLNATGTTMNLYSSALGTAGNATVISCFINCPYLADNARNDTGFFVPACTNRTAGKACMNDINPPAGNITHLTAGACP